MRYAVIEDGIVINIIKSDEAFATQYAAESGKLVINVDEIHCDIGYRYVDGAFLPNVEN